jgi:hypothetical protein
MAETKFENHRIASGMGEELNLSHPAITPDSSRQRVATAAALITVLAVTAWVSARGWPTTLHDLAHVLSHLPKPLKTLLGGSRLTRLLDPAQ